MPALLYLEMPALLYQEMPALLAKGVLQKRGHVDER